MSNQFVFVGCKFGFERNCKAEVLGQCENLRFAFSRPGFLTFKVEKGSADFSKINRLTFVRIAGLNYGKMSIVDGSIDPESLELIRSLMAQFKIKSAHVWNRDLGEQDDDKILSFVKDGFTELPLAVSSFVEKTRCKLNDHARVNEHVLNLIEVEPNEFWISVHQVQTPHQSFPGGIVRFKIPEKVVSRAYFKTKESLAWSRFPFQRNDTCIEIGCAPGGSAQALLENGLNVVGIDPALVDESISKNPRFIQIQKRGSEVRKKDLADAKWLFTDSNVAPNHSLDTIADMVANQHLNIQGMIVTFKLLQEKLADNIDDFLNRFRAMGFSYVRARQLAFNRNEICVAVLRRKSLLRFGKLKKKKTKPAPQDTKAPQTTTTDHAEPHPEPPASAQSNETP